MNPSSSKQESLKQRTQRSTKTLFIWTFSWVASLAVLSFGPKFIWDFNMIFSAMAILGNLVLGYKMIMANKEHLLAMDEMHQRIQLEAMGISLGVGLVIGTSYETLEDIRVISYEPEISHLIMVMAVVYMIRIILGYRKYA